MEKCVTIHMDKSVVISVRTKDDLKGVLGIIFKKTNDVRDLNVVVETITKHTHSNPGVVIFFNENKKHWTWLESMWYENDKLGRHISANTFIKEGECDEK